MRPGEIESLHPVPELDTRPRNEAMQSTIPYEDDIVAWANEQARLLRARRFDLIDIEHVAEEIEDVGKSEQRELENRLTVLLAHLLKWHHQPERRGNSWRRTIVAQRKDLSYHLEETPSLKPRLHDPRWLDLVWTKAVGRAAEETGLDVFPEVCPWTIAEIFDPGFYPDQDRSSTY